MTKGLTVSARLPYLIRQDIREGSHHHEGGQAINGVTERGDADGIGDLTLLGQYRFWNDKATRTEGAVLLGVKAPTGRSGLKDGNGEIFETEFQPGTGSWDGCLFGLGPWCFDASVLYVLATEGAQATDMGDRFPIQCGRLLSPVRRTVWRALAEPMYHWRPGKSQPQAHRGAAFECWSGA